MAGPGSENHRRAVCGPRRAAWGAGISGRRQTRARHAAANEGGWRNWDHRATLILAGLLLAPHKGLMFYCEINLLHSSTAVFPGFLCDHMIAVARL